MRRQLKKSSKQSLACDAMQESPRRHASCAHAYSKPTVKGKSRRLQTTRAWREAAVARPNRTILTVRKHTCTKLCCMLPCRRVLRLGDGPQCSDNPPKRRVYASIGTRRNVEGSFLGRAFRWNTSSMSRLGPMYSMFILKLALRMSGMCNCVLCFEWKRRLMQSSTRAMRPVATTTLHDALVGQRQATAWCHLL